MAIIIEPKWSLGWLEGFKSRNGIRKRKQHGEAALANIEGAEDRMVELRVIVQPYPLRDVYNMDETGLFWKATPDTTLATEALLGTKKQKARISLGNCSNADGSDKLSLLIIGSSLKPHCFSRNRINIASINIMWRHNKKAWMTTVIMLEWLTWFDKRIHGRKILLLIDGFSAHKAAVRILIENGSLKNTRVEFLPPNCTLVYQPLDQGIIANFKLLYRRYWLRFMVELSLRDENPIKQMHVLWAIRWSVEAWKEVIPQTIENCFIKSTLFGSRIGPRPRPQDYLDPPVINEMQQMAEQLLAAGRIYAIMNIREFIELPGEEVEDSSEDLIEHIVELYAGPDRDAETDEEAIEQPQIKLDEALIALQKLRLYEEQQSDSDRDVITTLSRHERRIQGRRPQNTKQQSIAMYFSVADRSITSLRA